MKITTFGRGNVGTGLGELWQRAGHEVTMLGREGGDVSDADVVLLAIPGAAVAEALDRLTGIRGKVVIDATNRIGVGPPAGFFSNAQYVKAKTSGPTAKAFNLNFARLYERLPSARKPPADLWCGDPAAREAVERLARDAGFDPICIGQLDMAATQEELIHVVFAIADSIGTFFLRAAPPEQL